MKGRIFDLQRFSVHDGPGIRTTVFLKGCPLRCAWCHNPEGLEAEPQLQFFADRCIGCGACGSRETLADAAHCPADALCVCGREIDERELIEAVLRDRPYYGETGGVTFSGGECLLQADFVAAALALAKRERLHTAIDTCGAVAWSEIEKTLGLCDLYLYDVKCIDPAVHRRYTGADNAQILCNLHRLSGTGAEIWVRIPVIPDFNDSVGEMTAIAELVEALPAVRRVTLMPYHSLGASKYETLGRVYPYNTSRTISPEKLARLREVFLAHGICVK